MTARHSGSVDVRVRRRRPDVLGLALGAIGTLSCGGGESFDTPVIELVAAPQSDAQNLTMEEAGHLAAGALFDLHGPDADPLPVATDGEIVEYRGQRVWRLDLTVELHGSEGDVVEEWRMWVGTARDESLAVLRAQRRR